ncbi:DUF1771-domain-containing protein [Epithele typhae]|uniref:DUF1771-domain-containing protein n=1 Tax=Epithele typhae TaxID=378194 RepID=UPI0020085A69|nr:DUF1771-domain-containing protein [Epithele typhae]KAH9940491.1 DUF1771-domain-containing protein [Epithele typhae]
MSSLLGALIKCLCGGSDSQGQPQQQQYQQSGYPGQQAPQVVQQPAPVSPPQQQHRPYSPPQQQQQPYSPPPQQQQPHRPPPQQQQPSYAQAAQEHSEPEHKKHKKKRHNGQGGHESEQENGAQIVHTPSPGPGRTSSPPDPNQVNQHNPYYTDLRARANRRGDEMARNFEEAHNVYESGDRARAKELSNAGKAAQREMEQLNEEAAAWIFRACVGQDSGPGEVDLHGLYVKEAIKYTDQSIQEARTRGDAKIRFIVGKGLHSAGHAAKLKPAIEELMQKHGLVAELDERNSGVLIVNLDGHASGGGHVMGADELTRGLEKKDECIIM